MNNVRILIEDEHFVAVQKNCGQLVVADRFGLEKDILLHRLGEQLRTAGHKADETGRDLYPVHRLDRDTSGVVLFAKNKDSHRYLSMMFEGREVTKEYWALTAGCPEWNEAVCRVPLKRAEGKKGRGRALIDLANGKESETHFSVKQRFGDVSLMVCKPYTGRLHQIRLHLKVMGIPILADKTYWNSDWKSREHPNLEVPNMMLHARQLDFKHPISKKSVSVVCPLAEGFKLTLDYLTKSYHPVSE